MSLLEKLLARAGYIRLASFGLALGADGKIAGLVPTSPLGSELDDAPTEVDSDEPSDDDDWQWQLALARAKAAAEVTAPVPRVSLVAIAPVAQAAPMAVAPIGRVSPVRPSPPPTPRSSPRPAARAPVSARPPVSTRPPEAVRRALPLPPPGSPPAGSSMFGPLASERAAVRRAQEARMAPPTSRLARGTGPVQRAELPDADVTQDTLVDGVAGGRSYVAAR